MSKELGIQAKDLENSESKAIVETLLEYKAITELLKDYKQKEETLKNAIKQLGVGKVTLVLDNLNLQVVINSTEFERKTIDQAKLKAKLGDLEPYKSTSVVKQVKISFKDKG